MYQSICRSVLEDELWTRKNCEIANRKVNHEDRNWDSDFDLQKSVTRKKNGKNRIKTGKKQNQETDCARNKTMKGITQETDINIQSSGGV